MMIKSVLLAVCLAGVALAAPFEDDETELMENEARFLYFNSSSTATSLTLLGALILLGVIAYLIYVGGLLSPAAYNRNDFYGQYQGYGNQGYGNGQYQARSASDGWDFNGLNVIQWISMLQEVYEKFDYNDLECQKRLICEVMREPDYFGSTARKMKHGFQLARYLEVLNMPDDFRELLDEYIDASDRANGQKDCNEFYQCPYSLKDSIKRNFSGNSL